MLSGSALSCSQKTSTKVSVGYRVLGLGSNPEPLTLNPVGFKVSDAEHYVAERPPKVVPNPVFLICLQILGATI